MEATRTTMVSEIRAYIGQEGAVPLASTAGVPVALYYVSNCLSHHDYFFAFLYLSY